MGHTRTVRLTTAAAARTSRGRSTAEAEVAAQAGVPRRRLIGAVTGLLLIGTLAAGCGGAGAASGAGGGAKVLTSAQHSASTSTTPSTGPSKTSSSTALPSCGSNRDPFDPTGSTPPAGSPALC